MGAPMCDSMVREKGFLRMRTEQGREKQDQGGRFPPFSGPSSHTLCVGGHRWDAG